MVGRERVGGREWLGDGNAMSLEGGSAWEIMCGCARCLDRSRCTRGKQIKHAGGAVREGYGITRRPAHHGARRGWTCGRDRRLAALKHAAPGVRGHSTLELYLRRSNASIRQRRDRFLFLSFSPLSPFPLERTKGQLDAQSSAQAFRRPTQPPSRSESPPLAVGCGTCRESLPGAAGCE
jgi:hypothetical protein